jgi:hypothetical protein
VDYLPELTERLRAYRKAHFAGRDDWFDDSHRSTAPPVFKKEYADYNVLVREGAGKAEHDKVTGVIPKKARHRWFRSMSSSQALAQSVFGNLIAYDKSALLRELKDAGGEPIFPSDSGTARCVLEYEVKYLGEPRSTYVDAFFTRGHRVAVECKLSEQDVGTCSRPRLKPKDDNYESDHCDGSYTRQRNRSRRCSLSAIGIKYWDYIPRLFDWPGDEDQTPCPLKDTYQIVRNILAACVREDGNLTAEGAHAVLLYDARNPAFQKGGAGRGAYNAVKEGLKAGYKGLLRQCTWQEVTAVLRGDIDMSWLTDTLGEKYGL